MYDFNGQRLTYPDIRMLMWGGGNPFHHHQDINKLLRGWLKARNDRRAGDVLGADRAVRGHRMPAATTLERNDIGAAGGTMCLCDETGAAADWEARSDLDIVTGLADRLGYGAPFAEGRDEMGSNRSLYHSLKDQLSKPADLDTRLRPILGRRSRGVT